MTKVVGKSMLGRAFWALLLGGWLAPLVVSFYFSQLVHEARQSGASDNWTGIDPEVGESYAMGITVVWFLVAPFGLVAYVVVNQGPHGSKQCKSCGYDLTGNTSGICSECGEQIPERTRRRIGGSTPDGL